MGVIKTLKHNKDFPQVERYVQFGGSLYCSLLVSDKKSGSHYSHIFVHHYQLSKTSNLPISNP